MQSIDQQAAASQTSGQPLSRNSRIQTPNSSRRALEIDAPVDEKGRSVCVCESAFIYNQYRSPTGGIYLSSQSRL